MKAAVLDHTGISPETYHQHLRKGQYAPGARPRALAQRVWDHYCRWLDREGLTGPQVAETVALQQFTQILPAGGREWVQHHRPSTLSSAVSLMEDCLAAKGTEASPWGSGNLSRRDRPGKGNPQGAETWEPCTSPDRVRPHCPDPRGHRVCLDFSGHMRQGKESL